MQEKVITIAPSGEVTSLHDDDMDLGFLGPQKIERVSEITFNEDTQSWDVRLMNQDRPFTACTGFLSYDLGRKFEVRWLNYCFVANIDPYTVAGSNAANYLRSADKVSATSVTSAALQFEDAVG